MPQLHHRFTRSIVVFFCLFLLLHMPFLSLAQIVDPSTVNTRQETLKQELQNLESEINQYQVLITQKRQESASLERDISLINAEIKKAQLEIRARTIAINNLEIDIKQRAQNVDDILARIDRDKIVLAGALRRLAEYDDMLLVEVILQYEKLSDFFGDTESLDALQRGIQESFDRLRLAKIEEEEAIEDLRVKRGEQLELRVLQELQQKKLKQQEDEKKSILTLTKGVESAYQKVVDAKLKNAAKIRSELFLLAGSPAIPFDEALQFANLAFEKTGVRPAFLLGIITQETELGKNIGQCNLPDDPPKYKWQQIMKPSRDHAAYLEITASLGLDPNLMPLSCPQAGGWGGAMGPAQFIPSTWMIVKDKVAKFTGHNPPNPWNPEDAFMASAVLLSDLGAYKRTYNAEWEAAMRYFAGSNWKKSAYRFYGDNVLALAEKYQTQIDILASVSLR